ncbi:hypothetical protein [Alkalicella caledoniensis]|uniref:hypothetical protein n=1 Tax=Alkalicella caledoniensis TaxID=2731377 RepID=UPI001FE42CCD|nr:hypothetical protein [Alkalicella caledoniensis]
MTYTLNLSRETDHFTLRFTDHDKECIDEVFEVLESSYNRITSVFKEKLEEKLIVEVYSEHKELLTALGFPNGPDWIRGGIGAGKILIASPLNPPPGSQFDNVVNTAVHEFVHKIIDKINADTPRWLNEGIASFEAKDNSENWIRKTVKHGIDTSEIPTFDDLDTGNDFQTFFNGNGYQFSYTMVEFIVSQFGYDNLIEFIKEPTDFAGVFGATKEQLQGQWVEYIKGNYSV